MRQAISTKYLGPTDHKGSRVKAVCEAGSIMVSWDHALNSMENHLAAARALASKLGWSGRWCGGCLHREASHAYAWVKVGDDDSTFMVEGVRP